MGRGTLGAAPSRASLGRPSMGPPGRWLAHEARSLGARLASLHDERLTVKTPRVGTSLGDQRDDDGEEHRADEFAAVLDRDMGPEHAARGIADAQCDPKRPLNLAVHSE